MADIYYTPPSNKVFEEVRLAALRFVQARFPYRDSVFWRDEKTAKILRMENVQDNFMYFFAMWDNANQGAFIKTLSPEAQDAYNERWDSVQSGGII